MTDTNRLSRSSNEAAGTLPFSFVLQPGQSLTGALTNIRRILRSPSLTARTRFGYELPADQTIYSITEPSGRVMLLITTAGSSLHQAISAVVPGPAATGTRLSVSCLADGSYWASASVGPKGAAAEGAGRST